MTAKLTTHEKFNNAMMRMRNENKEEFDNVLFGIALLDERQILSQGQLESIVDNRIKQFKYSVSNEYKFSYVERIKGFGSYKDSDPIKGSVHAINKDEAIEMAEYFIKNTIAENNFDFSFNPKLIKIKRVKK